MSYLNRFFSGLQRVTTSGSFIPEIDGLRFIAITAVVLTHLRSYFAEKSNWGTSAYVEEQYPLWNHVLANGHFGVELFFVISGFILALPFAKFHLKGASRPVLKSYYLRRVTRLEPPYFLAMVLLFLAHVFVVHKFTIQELIPSLAASLTYTHNFFYGYGVYPLVNSVAWSLEIEIQFYILAPLLFNIFIISSRFKRRMMISFAILTCILAQLLYQPPFLCLYQYLQYFLLGFLLVDLYLDNSAIKIGSPMTAFLGILAFVAIWLPNYHIQGDFQHNFLLKLLLVSSIFCFYYLALFTTFWKKIFTLKFITIVGGMCYSLYLLHYTVISMVGRLIVRLELSSNYYIDWIMKASVLSAVIFIVGTVFFKLVEQPCMRKDWYKRFLPQTKKHTVDSKQPREVEMH